MIKENEIALINRGKVAYLMRENIFCERIEKISRNGQEVYAFVYTYTDTIKDLLKNFDDDTKLKEYNNCFKNIAHDIKKFNELEE